MRELYCAIKMKRPLAIGILTAAAEAYLNRALIFTGNKVQICAAEKVSPAEREIVARLRLDRCPLLTPRLLDAWRRELDQALLDGGYRRIVAGCRFWTGRFRRELKERLPAMDPTIVAFIKSGKQQMLGGLDSRLAGLQLLPETQTTDPHAAALQQVLDAGWWMDLDN